MTFVLSFRGPLIFSFLAIYNFRSKKPPTFIISFNGKFSLCMCVYLSGAFSSVLNRVLQMWWPCWCIFPFTTHTNNVIVLSQVESLISCLVPWIISLVFNACFVLFNFGNGHWVTHSLQTKVTNSIITQIIQMSFSWLSLYNLFIQLTFLNFKFLHSVFFETFLLIRKRHLPILLISRSRSMWK